MNHLFMRPTISFTPVFVVWFTTKARVVPSPFVAAIYPVGMVIAGQPFKGWTRDALYAGRAARWYGAPLGVFTTAAAAEAVAARVREGFLEMLDDAGIPRPSGEEGVDMPF